jgi:hypothetical protein
VSEAAVTEGVEEVVAEVKDRLGERPPALMTGDESATYATVIAPTFSEVVPPEPAGPGRRPRLPERRRDPGLTSATVHKERGRRTASWRSIGRSCGGASGRWTRR